MLNKEKALIWADALESGKYAQAQHTLADKDKAGNCIAFCCLGVAHVVFVGPIADVEDTNYNNVREALNIDITTSDMFINMNDIHNKTFVEIAAKIREMVA